MTNIIIFIQCSLVSTNTINAAENTISTEKIKIRRRLSVTQNAKRKILLSKENQTNLRFTCKLLR